MNKLMKTVVGILALVAIVGVLSVKADTTTTVTNRGQVITIKSLSNVATDIKDSDMYQDFSVYPQRLGQSGKIVRFFDVAACGASGTNLTMLPAVAIPENILIRNGYYQVLTAMSPASTNTIRLNATADILGSGTNGFENVAGTRAAIIPVGTAATAVQTTAARLLKFEVTTGTLTAGRFMVVMDCDYAP